MPMGCRRRDCARPPQPLLPPGGRAWPGGGGGGGGGAAGGEADAEAVGGVDGGARLHAHVPRRPREREVEARHHLERERAVVSMQALSDG